MFNDLIRRWVDRQLSGLSGCRLPGRLDLSEAKRVIVFAPHPDDESLAVGGTLALLSLRCHVTLVLVTDGSGGGELPEGTGLIRAEEFKKAASVLGVQEVILLGEPDGEFLETEEFIAKCRKIFNDLRPNWAFLPSSLDYHLDHVRVSRSIRRLILKQSSVEKMLIYEVWAPVTASHVVDITEVVEIKRQAIRCHETALQCADYEGTILALNKYRGLYLGRGRWAEAFLVTDLKRHQDLPGRLERLAGDLLKQIHGEF